MFFVYFDAYLVILFCLGSAETDNLRCGNFWTAIWWPAVSGMLI